MTNDTYIKSSIHSFLNLEDHVKRLLESGDMADFKAVIRKTRIFLENFFMVHSFHQSLLLDAGN